MFLLAFSLQVAERLYISGYISYPRTESTAYPPTFDFVSLLQNQTSHPVWGGYAAALLPGAGNAGERTIDPL